MNLENIQINLNKIFDGNYQNDKQFLGVLLINYDDSEPCDISLSRSFSRDKTLRNKGYNDFNVTQYLSEFNSKLLELKYFNSNEIANKIQRTSNCTLIENSISYYSEDEDELDVNGTTELEEENGDLYEISKEMMIQMGFPTEFSSNKIKNSHKKSKPKEIIDMEKICDYIRKKIGKSIKNFDELISIWVDFVDKSGFSSAPQSFCVDLMKSNAISERNKERIKRLSLPTNESRETELILEFRNAIRDFWEHNSIDWITDLGLSDAYHNGNENYLRRLFGSIGFTFQSVGELDGISVRIHPVISNKSITFSERHELSVSSWRSMKNDQSGAANDERCCYTREDDPMNKYYFQRYRYFERFDEGILLDGESWYSVTPGGLARHVARRYRQQLGLDNSVAVVIDAFCGAGGNAIRFAEQGFVVLAIDLDRDKLRLLMHNAAVYGVDAQIVPVCCDFYRVSEWVSSEECEEQLRLLFESALAVNLSPPWGGPDYLEDDAFDIELMQFDELMNAACMLSRNVSCFIPRRSNCLQLVSWLANNSTNQLIKSRSIEIEQNCLENKIKALTLYTGQLVTFPDLGL